MQAALAAALEGRYEIDREIGRRGMATVYLARDLRHNRKVAVKVLNPELGAVLGVERFLAEIEVTANLQHPNLLRQRRRGAGDRRAQLGSGAPREDRAEEVVRRA